MATGSGTGRPFHRLSRSAMGYPFRQGNARGCSMDSACRLSGRRHIRPWRNATARSAKSLKKLRARRESGNYEIVYQDEVHFQLNTTIAAKWVRKGSWPRVRSAPGRRNASYSGYVLPSTGELFVTRPELVQFRDRDRDVQGIPCQVWDCRRKEDPDGGL